MKIIKRTIFISILTIFSFIPAFALAYVSVDGYYRSNGTYVEPHVRSEPNGIRYDNYGYDGGDFYNDSYGSSNYGSDWNTPSWNTDPNYYEGENLYESNQVDTYDSYNTYDYESSYNSYDSYDTYDSGFDSSFDSGLNSSFDSGLDSDLGF